MDRDVKNKSIGVIGGSVDLQFAVADHLFKKSAKNIVLCGTNEGTINEAVTNLNSKYGQNKAISVECNFTDFKEVTFEAYNKHGPFHILVVLSNETKLIDETNRVKSIEENVTWTIEWIMEYWSYVRKDKNKGRLVGSIVVVTSTDGIRINPYLPAYTASCSAVVAYTKSLGHVYNYERTGIRMVALCSGLIKTHPVCNIKTMTPEPNDKYQTDLDSFLKGQVWQSAESVGRAVVEVFERADSGTVWIVEGDSPIKQIQ